MQTKRRPRRPPEQFLGEIETEVVGLQYYGGRLAPGEHVNLEREPENQHDPLLIRVENGLFQTVGYVTRQTSSWLSPLIDRGQVRVEGYARAGADSEVEGTGAVRLVLMLFMSAKGEAILAPRPIETRLEALHAVAVWVYRDARSLTDPELIEGLAEGLEPLLHQDLLPESKLLLSLIPGIGRELQAAQGMHALGTLKAALDQLVIGQPVNYGGVTVFPLSWPHAQEPVCALFARAMRSGTATVEEVVRPGSGPQFQVHNKGLRPLLIPEGEILVGEQQTEAIGPVLISPKTSLTLPAGSVARRSWHRAGEDDGDHRADCRPENDHETYEDADLDLPLPEDAAGVAIGRNGRVLLLDLFDAAPTLANFWPRLREACAPYRHREKAALPVLPEQVRQVLKDIVDHARPTRASLGAGTGLEIVGNGLAGRAVLYADRVCHLNAFIRTSQTEQSCTPR